MLNLWCLQIWVEKSTVSRQPISRHPPTTIPTDFLTISTGKREKTCRYFCMIWSYRRKYIRFWWGQKTQTAWINYQKIRCLYSSEVPIEQRYGGDSTLHRTDSSEVQPRSPICKMWFVKCSPSLLDIYLCQFLYFHFI